MARELKNLKCHSRDQGSKQDLQALWQQHTCIVTRGQTRLLLLVPHDHLLLLTLCANESLIVLLHSRA